MPLMRQTRSRLVGRRFRRPFQRSRMRGRGLYRPAAYRKGPLGTSRYGVPVMRGRGGYFGRLIGSKFGMSRLGDKLGDMAGAVVRRAVPYGPLIMRGVNAAAAAHKTFFKGRGDYVPVVANSLVKGGGPPSVPTFSRGESGIVRISHREYLCDVYGQSSGFSNISFSLNPGLARTFPWLSQLAQNFEEYTMKQCVFTYRSTVSDFAANTGQVGQIIMGTQYNNAQPPFTNKRLMMEYEGSMSAKTSQDMIHGVECDPKKLSGSPGKYIRTAGLPGDQNINDYDCGQFNIAVSDTPAGYVGQVMGELWISYTVELRKPRMWAGQGYGIQRDLYCQVQPAPDKSVSLTNPFLNILRGVENSIGSSIMPFNTVTWAEALGNLPKNPQTGNPYVTGDMVPLGPQNLLGSGCCGIITIPNTFSGPLEIKLKIAPYEATSQLMYNFFALGSVTAFNDVRDPTATQWVNYEMGYWNPSVGDTNGTGVLLQVFHCLVTQPGGQPTYILVATPDETTQSDTAHSIELNFQQYDIQLSYAQDGSASAPRLEDAAGNTVPIA